VEDDFLNVRVYALESSPHLPRADPLDLREPITQRPLAPPRPHLTDRLETIYNHLPLSRVFPEIPEEPFLLWVVLSYPLQAAVNEAFLYRCLVI
jgi:hypothetical protein